MIQFKRRYFPEKDRLKWLIWLRWIWLGMMAGLVLFLYYLTRLLPR
ncbi:MAG: hypothetical protein ABIK93_07670 [candidate division WOR-3 bacterium]